MSAESKALPEFSVEHPTRGRIDGWRLATTKGFDMHCATESDLSAVLAAMDPEQRAKALDPYCTALLDWVELERTRAAKAEAELASERAKVAELTREERFAREALGMANREVDGLCAKLAKVAACDAFFEEHGALAHRMLVEHHRVTMREYAVVEALSTLLATMKETT